MVIPTHEDLYHALLAERHALVNGCTFVWLCCTESVWYVTTDRSKLSGRYARTTIGKADANAAIHAGAFTLIERVTHDEGTGY